VSFGIQAEVFFRFPRFTDFDEHGTDESQQSLFVQEESGDAGAVPLCGIHLFEQIGGRNGERIGGGKEKNTDEAFRQVFGHPGGKSGGASLIAPPGLIQETFRPLGAAERDLASFLPSPDTEFVGEDDQEGRSPGKSGGS